MHRPHRRKEHTDDKTGLAIWSARNTMLAHNRWNPASFKATPGPAVTPIGFSIFLETAPAAFSP